MVSDSVGLGVARGWRRTWWRDCEKREVEDGKFGGSELFYMVRARTLERCKSVKIGGKFRY
jgi:hypothetical protein